jgi:hypothetical protein
MISSRKFLVSCLVGVAGKPMARLWAQSLLRCKPAACRTRAATLQAKFTIPSSTGVSFQLYQAECYRAGRVLDRPGARDANRENLARKVRGAIHVIADSTWLYAPVPQASGAIH